MPDQMTVPEKRRFNPAKEILSQTGLYHSFILPDGTQLNGLISLDVLSQRLASFRLPADLRGRRVLDIGPWDGFFTFELERRGAELTAIDYVDLDTFRMLRREFDSKARYLRMDVYELAPANVGAFDIVLCLGVLYHLKHPLLALEKICAITTDVCIIETFVTDGVEWAEGRSAPMPSIEFYEREELGGQLDNWCGPSVSAVEALARSAGFARTEVLRVTGNHACVAAYRRWANLPPDETPPPRIVGLTSHQHRGRSFRTEKEEYIHLWSAWDKPGAPPLREVFPEVDGYGIPVLSCSVAGDSLLTNFRLPPGLAPGRHVARLKIGTSGWSDVADFYVDLPDLPAGSEIRLLSVQDGVTWRTGEVDWRNDGWATVWVTGLSEAAEAGTTVVEISGIPHWPEMLDLKTGQINFRLRPLIGDGVHELRVLHRGAVCQPLRFTVTGTPPLLWAGL